MLQLRNDRACSFAIAPLLLVAAGGRQFPVRAGDNQPATPISPDGVGPREIWFGADAGLNNWLVYTGGTYAPWSDIHADGFRLRSTAGYGSFSYSFDAKTKVRATKNYSDVLAGYQQRFGELTAKAFIGYAILNQQFEVPASSFRAAKLDSGLKGAVELWLNLGPTAWTSLDMSYADTRQSSSIRSRTGYRVLPTVSAGVEAIFNHSDLSGLVQSSAAVRLEGNTRIGGFLRYEWFGGEISASGGLSGDWIEKQGKQGGTDLLHASELYGTLNWITQY